MIVNLLLLSLCLVQALAASDVIELKDANFESEIRRHEVALVEFYAPWCGHCKRLAPEYEIAATALKKDDSPVALVKVDCTVETKSCQKHGVSGYPTLKIFKGGEVASDYQGPREADGIIKYMRTKAGPAAKDLTDLATADKFLSHYEHSIVCFVTMANSKLLVEFKKLADSLAESYRFGYSSNPEVLAKYGHTDKIVIYQPQRLQVKLLPSESVYTGAKNSGEIRAFIENEFHGLVGHRTMSNAVQFKGPLVVVSYGLDYVKDVKGSNYVRNRVIKVAQKLRGEGLAVNFAVSAAGDFQQEMAEFGIAAVDGEKYIIGRGAKNEKFKFEGEYSVEALEKFARDLVAGALEQYLKSEPLPEASDEAVVTLVARNFNEVVDGSKDVLVEFYAPWCGHCKSLAPVYEEVAQKLKDEDGVVLAKLDATANDVPSQFDVKGFPTLYFVKKGQTANPMKYESGRDADSFIKFLAKESTDGLKGYGRDGKKKKKTEL